MFRLIVSNWIGKRGKKKSAMSKIWESLTIPASRFTLHFFDELMLDTIHSIDWQSFKSFWQFGIFLIFFLSWLFFVLIVIGAVFWITTWIEKSCCHLIFKVWSIFQMETKENSNNFFGFEKMDDNTGKWNGEIPKGDWVVCEKVHGSNFCFIVSSDHFIQCAKRTEVSYRSFCKIS